jgi:hypothetical protein
MADKLRERWYVQSLRAALPAFPSGQIVDGESPDFTVTTDRGVLGIEVTEFYLRPSEGRPHQEQQKLKNDVVATARRLHCEAGGPALWVRAVFRRPLSITKRDVDPWARVLVTAVSQSPISLSTFDPPTVVEWGRLPAWLVALTIRPGLSATDHLWAADAGGWVAPLQPTDVEREIERKRGMCSVARAKCHEVWLLIVNNEFSLGAPAELSEAARLHAYAHLFDRLFWLEPHRELVTSLTKAASTSAGAL